MVSDRPSAIVHWGKPCDHTGPWGTGSIPVTFPLNLTTRKALPRKA